MVHRGCRPLWSSLHRRRPLWSRRGGPASWLSCGHGRVVVVVVVVVVRRLAESER
jgi:hypothetical protein